ncbi:MAG: dihydrolipoyl dehydrogenase [Lentisphaerae bacterium]|nr:dihydrolipoyl dehydrogenase [Lentisphaerota bacterium]
MEKFDIVVVGSGPGGYPAAIRAAQLGANVALVEKQTLGGTCLNRGCIPTKALIAASSMIEQLQHADKFGIKTGPISFDYAAMIKRKDEVVTTLRTGVEQLLKANKIHILSGTASFINRQNLRIASGDSKPDMFLQTDSVVLATGSESFVPGFIPKNPRIFDSTMFLEATKLPTSMIILGGGVIGCEFACMTAPLGVKVTIVEMLDDILMVLDKDVRAELRRHMENSLGIRILTGKPLEKIKATKTGVSGFFGDKQLNADTMLVSIGRKPVSSGLSLDTVGVETNQVGNIVADPYMQTSATGIYAIGDVVAGSTQLAHAATSQGITAAENICTKRLRRSETSIPACIFTSPEVGSVGLTEQLAVANSLSVKTGKFVFKSLGKALAAGEPDGFVKWVADTDTARLLGAHAIGAHATELIAEAATAIRSELTIDDIAGTIHCHPTFSEAWMEAAHAFHGECINAAPKRKR